MPIGEGDATSWKTPETLQSGSSLSEQFWQEMRRGGRDELKYAKDHPLTTGVKATVAAGLGYMAGDGDILGSTARKFSILGGVTVSALHFAFPDHAASIYTGLDKYENASWWQKSGYLAGRFTTDASAMVAASMATGKITWTVNGNRALDGIIARERSILVYDGKTVRPNGNTIYGYSEDIPVFRQERGESAAGLLLRRGEPERMPAVIERLKSMPEPENIVFGSDGSTAVKSYYGIPKFDPAALIGRVKGLQ